MEELVVLKWVGSALEGREVVGQVGQACNGDGGVPVSDFGGGGGGHLRGRGN